MTTTETLPSMQEIAKLMPTGRLGYAAVSTYLGYEKGHRLSEFRATVATLATEDREKRLEPPLSSELSDMVQLFDRVLNDGSYGSRDYGQVEAVDALMAVVIEHGIGAIGR